MQKNYVRENRFPANSTERLVLLFEGMGLASTISVSLAFGCGIHSSSKAAFAELPTFAAVGGTIFGKKVMECWIYMDYVFLYACNI